MGKLEVPKLVVPEARIRPPRVVLIAVEGWGKTSCLAYAKNPAILMAAGENGYETLLGAGRVPAIPAATSRGWEETLGFLDEILATEELPFRTLGLDALGGFEHQCHQFVCNRDFKGDWGEKGFVGFQRGFRIAKPDWMHLLSRLEKINQRGITIMLLCHCQIGSFDNPEGDRYNYYTADVHNQTWEPTSKWADAVLFGKYEVIVDGDKTHRRGIGGSTRLVYTQRRDAWAAKNRYGMPEVLEIPNDHTRIWSTISAAMINGAKKEVNNATRIDG